ncbi:MAG: hypothetical protein HQ515_17605 [Phycisphaeraceae bacterium]|nr:hypothetical protein [Phycisphaeraceae bacterium]
MSDPKKTCDSIRIQIEDLTQTQLVHMQIPGHMADHVRSCALCKSFLDQQLALATQVHLWTVPEPQKQIGTGVMTQIAQLEHDKLASSATFWAGCIHALRYRAQIPVSLAAVVLVALAVSVVFNVSHPNVPNTFAQETPSQINTPGTIQVVQPSLSEPRILNVSHDELRTIHPWLSQTQLPPSTMVIILGAPLLPWTESLPKPAHNQSQSL